MSAADPRCTICTLRHPQGHVPHGAAPLYNCVKHLAEEVRRLTAEVKALRNDVGAMITQEEHDAAIDAAGGTLGQG